MEEWDITKPDPIEPGDMYADRVALRKLVQIHKRVYPVIAILKDQLLINSAEDHRDSLDHITSMIEEFIALLGRKIQAYDVEYFVKPENRKSKKRRTYKSRTRGGKKAL